MPLIALIWMLDLCHPLRGVDCPPELAKHVANELKFLSRTILTPDMGLPRPLEAVQSYHGEKTLLLARIAMRSPHAHVRLDGIDLASRLGIEAIDPLADLGRDPDVEVRCAAIAARARLAGHAALPALRGQIGADQARVREAAVQALGAMGWPDVRDPALPIYADMLRRCARDSDAAVRIAAIRSAAASERSEALAILHAACGDVNEAVALEAAALVADHLAGARHLHKNIAHLPVPSQVSAMLVLTEWQDGQTIPLLLQNLKRGDARIVATALECLRRYDLDESQRAQLNRLASRLLRHEAWWVRASACDALARHGDAATLRLLVAHAQGSDLDHQAAIQACKDLSGQPFNDPAKWQDWLRTNPQPVVTPGTRRQTASLITFCSLQDRCESVVYVVDTSGSMGNSITRTQDYYTPRTGPDTKFDLAKQELIASVMALQSDTRVDVIFFASEVVRWQPGPVRASWRMKHALRETLGAMEADGGTATCPALHSGLANLGAETLFFLTDGMPTHGENDPERICAAVTAANASRQRPLRLHCIALRIEEAEMFLSRLARDNGGQYQVVD